MNPAGTATLAIGLAKRAIQLLTPGWHRPNALIVHLGAELLDDPRVHRTYAAWAEKSAPQERQRR